VCDRDDLPQAQPLDDRLQVSQLLLETIGRVGGFVRRAKAQEIEGYNASPAGDQIGDQIVPDMQIVREAMHEHKGGADACVIASVDPCFSARDVSLGKRDRIRGHASPY